MQIDQFFGIKMLAFNCQLGYKIKKVSKFNNFDSINPVKPANKKLNNKNKNLVEAFSK